MLKKKIFLILICIVIPAFSSPLYHHVQKGDTLYGIAKKYDISLSLLVKANHINKTDRLLPGKKLLIPSSYQVKKGDTLYALARRFNCNFDTLLKINQLDKNSILKVGQHLIIPKSTSQDNSIVKKDNNDYQILWPVKGSRRNFGDKMKGVEIRALPGSRVICIRKGRVIWIGPYFGFKQVVFVQDPGGLVYIYAGNEKIFVKPGQWLNKGDLIGQLVNSTESFVSMFFYVHNGRFNISPEKAPRG